MYTVLIHIEILFCKFANIGNNKLKFESILFASRLLGKDKFDVRVDISTFLLLSSEGGRL